MTTTTHRTVVIVNNFTIYEDRTKGKFVKSRPLFKPEKYTRNICTTATLHTSESVPLLVLFVKTPGITDAKIMKSGFAALVVSIIMLHRLITRGRALNLLLQAKFHNI